MQKSNNESYIQNGYQEAIRKLLLHNSVKLQSKKNSNEVESSYKKEIYKAWMNIVIMQKGLLLSLGII